MGDTLKSVSSLPGVAILALIITVFQPLSASQSPRVFHAPLSMCNAPNIAKVRRRILGISFVQVL